MDKDTECLTSLFGAALNFQRECDWPRDHSLLNNINSELVAGRRRHA
jgi:hypothetical protein